MSLCTKSLRTFGYSRKGRASRAFLRRSASTVDNGIREESDVVIVGGGPAGLALASALGSSQTIKEMLNITLVEAGDLSKVREWAPQLGGFSNRVSSLTNASQHFLKDIGAWSHVETSRTSPVEEMQVWDGISDARITFSASELALDSTPVLGEPSQMARLTENLNLQRGLIRHLNTLPEVRVLDNVKVSSIQREEREGGGGWPLVHLSDGRVLRTRLLVGADGFNSPVRSYAGISSYGWAYDTQAIVATLSHSPRSVLQPPNTIAYQRFLPTGPIAFLPLSATASSLVWSTKPSLAAALVKSDPAILTSMINAAFRLPDVSMRYLHDMILESSGSITSAQIKEEIGWRERSHGIDMHSAYASASSELATVGIPPSDSDSLPPLVSSIEPGTVASFPLRFNHADAYIGEGVGSRTVLVGDAGHTVHPLAGQGLNMGLGDVEALARCIEEAVLQGSDIGSHTALLPYAQERYLENHKLMSAVDKLHKLYSSTLEPIVWGRSVGLEVLNEFDVIKTAIMADAGARSRRHNTAAGSYNNWNLTASGIESLVSGVNTVRVVGDGLAGAAGAAFQSILRAAGSYNQSK